MKASLSLIAYASSIFYSIAWAQAPSPSDTNQAMVEWQTNYEDETIESNEKLLEPFKNSLDIPSNKDFKLSKNSDLSDFSKTLQTAIHSLKPNSDSVLRIFVDGHGDPGDFAIKDGKKLVYYKDFTRVLADDLKKANPRPRVVDLYMVPCYSGSMLEDLEKYLATNKIPGVTVNVWMGSSADRETTAFVFANALQELQGLQSKMDGYLSSAHPCPGPSTNQPGIPNVFSIMGEANHALFWSNSGTYRDLTQGELESLVQSGNPTIEEQALYSLTERNMTSLGFANTVENILDNSSQQCATREQALNYLISVHPQSTEIQDNLLGILTNSSNSEDLRTDVVEALSKLPSSPKVISVVSALAHSSTTKGSYAADSNLSMTALETLGHLDPSSAPFLKSVFLRSDDGLTRGFALKGLIATGANNGDLIPTLRSLFLVTDAKWTSLMGLPSTAGEALVKIDPNADKFFKSVFFNKKNPNLSRNLAVEGISSVEQSRPEALLSSLKTMYSFETDPDLKTYILYYAGKIAKSAPALKSSVQKAFGKEISACSHSSANCEEAGEYLK